ncbi:alpha/beta hydrolase [Rarobacter incanus]|uniref:Alpha-beta hydrolase superfamily lysophospholipase n=1 Tax=Rarobacter incanus TaxID=153494 RepID=A0A542SRF6_9MICO|nr:alpha/beta hydrolase [Rarobacter incanus]TQK76797.1 alpha-beta hydrolase superfamily lysophospholipase [Rarobacter incanus]
MLYIHGFADYFFQAHLGKRITAAGYGFFAIDLRRYGRSLRSGQTANYTDDLSEYFEELDAAIRIITTELGYSKVVVMGHSTGGLIAPLWISARAHARTPREGGKRSASAKRQTAPIKSTTTPTETNHHTQTTPTETNHHTQTTPPAGPIAALVLNSPWIAMQGPAWWRALGAVASRLLSPIAPRLPLSSMDVSYRRALHLTTGGEWAFDLSMRPEKGFPARAAWLAAIRRGHRAVQRGLALPVPVLVACSTENGPRSGNHERLLTSDSVLDADRIAAASLKLGPRVDLVRFAGAHDLALSPEPIRTEYIDTVAKWIEKAVDNLPQN